jgi:NADH-quinone oxidoreductase subunit H
MILFFGGWHFPGLSTPESHWVVKLIVFAAKMFLMIFFFMMVRWTIPRFRFDQLMGIAWRVLIPLSLANLVAVIAVKALAKAGGWSDGVQMVVLFVVSVALLVVTGALSLRPRARAAAVSG